MIIMCMSSTYNSQISPIQHIAQTFCAISLYNTLATAHFGKIEHIVGQLVDTVVQTNVSTVHNVDAVGRGIGNLLLHKTTEARQIGGDTWNAHNGTFGRCIAPWFIVGWEDAQVTATHEFFVVQAE